MPDVKLWLSPYVQVANEEGFKVGLKDEVAKQMSCYVLQVGGGYNRYVLNSDEVDIPVCGTIAVPGDSKVIMEVAAYGYEDRMRNIDERIFNIAEWVRDRLGLRGGTVSITFFRVEHRCWMRA